MCVMATATATAWVTANSRPFSLVTPHVYCTSRGYVIGVGVHLYVCIYVCIYMYIYV